MKSVKLACLVVAFVFILPLVYAENKEENRNLDVILGNLTAINDQLAKTDARVPEGVNKIINHGNLTVNVTRTDGSYQGVSLEIDNGRLLRVSEGFAEKKEYQIFLTEETLNDLLSENGDPLTSYKEGKIVIKAYGLGNNVKFFFAKIFLKFAG